MIRRNDRAVTTALVLIILAIGSGTLPAKETIALPVQAETALRVLPVARPAKIAIIIDDLGYSWRNGARAVALPGPVAFAILPFTRFSTRLAKMANQRSKEVLLHLPMEPEGHHAEAPGTLRKNMDRNEFMALLRASLAAVPYVIGINNHQGSLLTQQPREMTWLMEELQRDGRLFFVDSRTSPHSIANRYARIHGLAHVPRNIFLDHERTPQAVNEQFEALVTLAKRRGFALAIGHPYPETLDMLEQQLPNLVERGIELVAVSSVIGVSLPTRIAAGSSGDNPISSMLSPVVAHNKAIELPEP